jgi:hypothetical protein
MHRLPLATCRSGALGGWGGGAENPARPFPRRRRTVASSVAARPIRVQPATAHLRVHTRTTSDALCYSYCVTSTETALPSLAHLPQNEKLWIALGEFPNPTGTQVPDSRNPQRCNPCTHSDLFDGHATSSPSALRTLTSPPSPPTTTPSSLSPPPPTRRRFMNRFCTDFVNRVILWC